MEQHEPCRPYFGSEWKSLSPKW